MTYWLDGEKCLEVIINEAKRYVATGYDEETGELVLKFVNATEEPYATSVRIVNSGKVHRQGKVTVLSSSDPEDENTLDEPQRVYPEESVFNGFGKEFNYTFEPWSFTVLRIKAEK